MLSVKQLHLSIIAIQLQENTTEITEVMFFPVHATIYFPSIIGIEEIFTWSGVK